MGKIYGFLVFCSYFLFNYDRLVQASSSIDPIGACENGWTYYGSTNKCYKVILNDMDWDTALDSCIEQNSMIVSIHSRQHNEFLINMTLKVQPTDLTEMYAFWIGYYDTYSYSNWFINNDYWDNLYVYLNAFQWLDGSMTDYTNWGLTKNGNMEPDYHFMAYTPLQANRSCTVLLADYKGKIDYWNAIKTQWFDDNYGCSSKYSGTICQKDSKIVLNITINDDIEYFCDDGWTLYGVKDALNHTKNMCYQYIYQQNMDYFDAKQHCDSMNSSMVYIENQYETNFLLNLINQTEKVDPNVLWFIFIGLNDYNNSGIWRFPDGTPAEYFKWYQHQPVYSRMIISLQCGFLGFGGANQPTYAGKIFEGLCTAQGERTICKKSPNQRKKSNSTVTATTFNSLPTNISAIMERYRSRRATDTGCPTNSSAFPCPYPNPVDCPVPQKQYNNIGGTDSAEFCESGWTYFNRTKKCYQVILEDMTLFDSVDKCKSMNATLVSIHGEAHNDFLISLARSLLSPNSTTPIPSFYAFWISFIEFNRTFEWNWLDGSPVDYVKWARYMPKMLFDLIPLIDYQTPSCTILVAKSEPIPFRSCCYYLYQDLTSFWVDVEVIRQSCYSKFSGAICQKNSSVSSAISNNNEGSISSVSNLQCDDGWTQYELKNVLGERYNMCYSVIYNETKITSDEGLNYCSSVNASLTVLENQDELKFIKEKLIIRSNTRASFSFWINPIADACGFHKPEWNITWPEKNGIDVDWDGYNTMYSSCCDSTFYWANTSLTSEYFPFKFYEPYFHLNKSCIAISVDGDNDFEVPRNGGIFAEYCDYPHIGAICKKKPDKPIKPVQKLINMQSNPSTTQTIIDNSGFTTNYSATYKSTLSPKFCVNPPSGYPSMLVSRDTRHYDLNRTKDPIAICPCKDGNRLYWLPSNDSLPSLAYDNSELALIVYQYEKNFEENGLWDGVHDFCNKSNDCIDRGNHCPSICICDIDGNCYKPYRYNTEVLFVPYCDGTGCYVYAAVSMGKLCRGCDRNVIENCWDCIEHDTTHESIGPSSRYIKVDRVGCFDCLSIVYTKCPANDFSNVGLPGWPSVVTFNLTPSNPHTRLLKHYEDPTRYMHWTFGIDHTDSQTWAPYVIHPGILNREYATDAFKDILYECVWFYGFQFNETGRLTKNYDYSYFTKQAKHNSYFNSTDKYSFTDYIADSYDWIFMANMSSINLFNEARQSQLELLMENALRTNNFEKLGENCSSLNYNRFKQVRPDIDKKWQDGIKTFDKLRAVNFGLNMFFGIIGIFISLVVIRLIHKYIDLKTPYGYFCLIQAYIDLILLGNTVLFEGSVSVRTMFIIGEIENLGHVDFTLDQPTLPWRWDYLMFYIYYSTKFATSVITFLKAFTRAIAVYFPMFFYYNQMFDQKHTVILCLGILGAMFLGSLPITLPPPWTASMCKVIFARSQYIPMDTCSQIYWWVQTYAEFILAMSCFVLDMATFYKLIRINRVKISEQDRVENHKRLLERLFLIQNFGDLTTFAIMFIPNIIYAAGCQYDRWHCIAGGSNGIVSMIYQITVLLFLHSSRITIWRCFDEFVSLLCQWRILKQQSKTHTEVKSVPNQTISTRTS